MEKTIIPEGSYSGYYWMSDSTDPVVLSGGTNDAESLDNLNKHLERPTDNPFVIEAQLYDADAGRSFSIKYVDGAYIINHYDLKSDDMKKECHIVHKRYYANRMPGRQLHFLQYWRGQKDGLCEGMNVLQPAEMVFVGFKPINQQDSHGK